MKLTKQSYEILEQEIPVRKMDDYDGSHFREQYIDNMYKHIERCGRICYKSENKITETSAKRFVEGLIHSSHLSVLEHGIVYLAIPATYKSDCNYANTVGTYFGNPYCKIYRDVSSTKWMVYITTNYRVIIENGWEDDLQYLCEPTEYHEKRHTVLLHSCIHVYKDLTRHRKASFSIESTRFCCYSQNRFGGELKFVILPWCKYISPGDAYWYDGICYRTGATEENEFMGDRSWTKPEEGEDELEWKSELKLIRNLDKTQNDYNEFTKIYGWTAQEAAEILPQCTAADVVMTAFDSDWSFIFQLRSNIAATGKPHPLVEELMTPLRDEFKEKGWIK